MIAGVIDIGSNSIKLMIGENVDGQVHILESLKNIVPIGQDTFYNGRISQSTVNQTITVLEKYDRLMEDYKVEQRVAIATTAVREARNRDIFIDAVLRKRGFNIEVLNVGDVVYYLDTFLSHSLTKKYPIHSKNVVIAELGAGSLDISVLEKGYTLLNIGISIGTLRVQQFLSRLDGSQEEVYEALEEYIDHEVSYLKEILPRIKIDDIILVDESFSPYLEKIMPIKKQDPNFFQFRKVESDEIVEKLSECQLKRISKTYGIPAELAEKFFGYTLIVNKLFKLSRNKYINILKTSLPEAVLANILFGLEHTQEYNKEKHLISVAQNLCRKFREDTSHIKNVVKFAKKLFGELQGFLGLADSDRLYLILAAYLHDIGMFINNRAHHKHSEYIINSLNLFRLTAEEMKMIACIARYHRRGFPSANHFVFNSLGKDQQIIVQKLSAILRIANSLDRSHRQKIRDITVKIDKEGDVEIIAETNRSLTLEQNDFAGKKALFEEVTGSKVILKSRRLSA